MSKKIIIDDKYFLTNDSNQWVLNYESKGDLNEKTGKPTVTTDKWYSGSLEASLKRYINEVSKPATDWEALTDFITYGMNQIDLLVKNLSDK